MHTIARSPVFFSAAALSAVLFTTAALPSSAQSDLSFAKHAISWHPGGAQKVVTVDFDGDGDVDLLSSASGIKLWENIGADRFVERNLVSDVGLVISIEPADLDHDGDLDIAAACYDAGAIMWFENSGELPFTRHVVDHEFAGAHDVAVRDIDGDGVLDLAGARGDQDGNGEISWWRNDGGLAFTKHGLYADDFSHCVVAADVDLDGDVDLLGTQFDTGWRLWRNDGSGGFQESFTAFAGAHHLKVADVDGDAIPDILAAGYIGGRVAVWRGTANGAFEQSTVATGFGGVVFVDAGDLDNDGDLDIVAGGSTAHAVKWWENVGSMSFTEHTVADFLYAASGVSVADLDGDGDLDVAGTAWQATLEISWWESSLISSSRGAVPCRRLPSALY